MHKVTLAAVAAVAVIAAVHARGLTADDVKTVSQKLGAAIPKAAQQADDLHTETIRSALAAFPKTANPKYMLSSLKESMQNMSPKSRRAGGHKSKVADVLGKLKKAVQTVSQFESPSLATGFRKAHVERHVPSSFLRDLHGSHSDGAAPQRALLQDDDDDELCTALDDLTDPPTQEQMMMVCEDTCCGYDAALAFVFDLSLADVKQLACSKTGDTYCVTNPPDDFANDDPTPDELDDWCNNMDCRSAWIGNSLIEDIVEGIETQQGGMSTITRRNSHKTSPWDALADWVCAKDPADNSYCLVSDALDTIDFAMPTAANLTALCGGCKSFYFDLLESFWGIDRTVSEELICAKDGDNWCALTIPELKGDDPTLAEMDTVCTNENCKTSWVISYVLDDVDIPDPEKLPTGRRDGHMNKVAPEDVLSTIADAMCTKNSTGTGYCYLNAIDPDEEIPDNEPPAVEILNEMCGACKDLYLKPWAIEAGLPPSAVETYLCSTDTADGKYCMEKIPQVSLGSVRRDGHIAALTASLDAYCANDDCRATWIGATFASESFDTRRAGHMPPSPDQVAETICSKAPGNDGEYCYIQLQKQLEGLGTCYGEAASLELLTPGLEGLEEMCNVSPVCVQKYPMIATELLGDAASAEALAATLEYSCVKVGGEYCSQQVEMGLASISEADQAKLQVMCGNCITKLGPTAGLLLMASLLGGFGGRRSEELTRSDLAANLLFPTKQTGLWAPAHNEEHASMSRKLLQNGGIDDIVAQLLGVVLNIMCLQDKQGQPCLKDESASNLLFGGEDLFKPLDPESDSTNAERTAFAKQYCENPCLTSYIGLSAELAATGGGIVGDECIPDGIQFQLDVLGGGCQKPDENSYCLSQVFNDFQKGENFSMACGVNENFELMDTSSNECSPECKTAVEALYTSWGCCTARVAPPVMATINTNCGTTLPAACSVSGKVKFKVAIGNLKRSWLQSRLNGRILKALKTDLGRGIGVSNGNIGTITTEAISGGGTSLMAEVEASSAEMGRQMLRKLKKKRDRRSDGMEIAFTSLSTAVSEAGSLADALEDPEAGLTGAVDTTSIDVEGEEIAAIEAEINEELGITPIDGGAATLVHSVFLVLLALVSLKALSY